MNPFLENTPFLRLFIALSVGVGLRALIGVSLSLLIPLFIIGSILFGLTLFQKRLALQGQRGWFGLMLMLWLVGLGWQINNAYYASHIPFQYQSDGVYEVVVDRFPIERPKSVMVYATVQGRVVDHTLKNMHGRVILYLEKDSAAMSLTPGRELLYLGGFSLPQGQHPNGFDYGKYLYENGIMGSGYADVEHWKPVGVSSQFHVKWMAERWRYELLKRLRSIPLQPDVLQLVSAVTLGYRDEMPKPLKSIYRDSGASHVLAVSGLHVGILFMMLLLLFRFLDRWVAGVVIKPILIILLLWGYALITGLSPSVCRAAFM